MTFPFDFGFVPSTVGDDGDPLDILVLMDSEGIPGCVLKAKPLGAIEARQREKGGEWVRNDRVIALAVHARIHEDAKTLDELGPHVLKDIKAFFIQYNELHEKKFECLKDRGPKGATKLIEAGAALFKKKHRRNGQ
jgi:inorganic pyrophosphatase